MSRTADLESIAFAAGLKPAIRRTVDPSELDAVEAQLRAPGVVVLRARRTARLGAREQAVLYVARTAEHAGALRDAEEAVLPGASGAPDARERHREVGRLLGFPPCCVEAFLARLDRGVDRLDARGPGGLAEDYVAARSAWVPRPDARVNPLLMAVRAQLVSFYPCRYDCPEAVGVAEALRAVLERRQPAAAAALLALLSRPVAIAPDGARALLVLGGALDGAVIARAVAPRRSDAKSDPRDVALADTLVGASVAPDGALGSGEGAFPIWCVDFSARAAAEVR